MTTTDKLWFNLIIAEPDVAERTVVVCPRYDNLKLKDSKPSGKMYYKKSLSGTVKFLGVDFTTIYSCALRTKYTLVVYQHSVGEIVRATFRKTDCKWDVNHQIAEVDIAADDPYKKIEDNKDNEYNLVKLNVTRQPIDLQVYPSLELYFHNREELSMIGVKGLTNTFNNGVRAVSSVKDLENMGFSCSYGGYIADARKWLNAILASCVMVPLNNYGLNDGYYEPTGGMWKFDKYIQGQDTLICMQNLFRRGDTQSSSMDFIRVYLNVDITGGHNMWYNIYYFKNANPNYDGQVPHAIAVRSRDYVNTDQVYSTARFTGDTSTFTATRSFTFVRVIDSRIKKNSYVNIDLCRFWLGYQRIVSYKTSLGYELNGDDVYKANYMSASPSTKVVTVKISSRVGDDYLPPDDRGSWEPILKEEWGDNISLWYLDWVDNERCLTSSEWRNYSGSTPCHDFISLGDAIKAVLTEITPNIVFDKDTEHSKFLFASINPVSGARQGAYCITQKSNILNLNYDYPAWLAPVTWGKIETLLKNAFNCYWDLYERDGATHLRIEHRTFYDRGGTYTENNPRETHDLRTVYRNSTPYSYANNTNHWEWDKDGNGDSTASRYEYSWMDTQSEMFDGKTIEVPERYRLFDDDKLEERKVDWFSSDIDFLISVQQECSSDGFAIVMVDPDEPYSVIHSNNKYLGQNYELSFEYLQPKYLLAGIYSPVVKIGSVEVQNAVTARLRKADVDFRLLQGEDVEAGDILITEVGEGLIDSLEEDLHSGKMTATVRYENE